MPILHHGGMTPPSDPAEDRVTEGRYGFAWGPMLVTRIARLPDGRRVLGIATDDTPHGHALEITVSAQGKRVRVFKSGVELVAPLPVSTPKDA